MDSIQCIKKSNYTKLSRQIFANTKKIQQEKSTNWNKKQIFYNEAEIIEKEHGLYPFCHQQKIKNEYKKEKKPFEIIRTILKVAKLLLDYALKKKNFTKWDEIEIQKMARILNSNNYPKEFFEESLIVETFKNNNLILAIFSKIDENNNQNFKKKKWHFEKMPI